MDNIDQIGSASNEGVIGGEVVSEGTSKPWTLTTQITINYR